MPDRDQKEFWFPAKRYGWGWGLPATWQGWVVIVVWLVAVVVLSPILVLYDWRAFVAFIVTMVAVLIGICLLTGEPPRWRWGDDGD